MFMRTTLFILALSLAILLSLFSENSGKQTRAPAKVSDTEFGKPNQQLLEEFSHFTNLLPQDARDAWLEYISRISKIHSGSNETIESANWSLTEQPCFSDLAAEFYGWLLEYDLKSEHTGLTKPLSALPLKGRASLEDEAGSGRFQNIAPGSVWKKALDLSGGQANVAMALIGLCGHDDAIAIKPKLLNGRQATTEYRALKKKGLQSLRNDLLNELKITTDHDHKKFLVETLDSIDDLLSSDEIDSLYCSDASLLYLPKALDSSLDLDPTLKDRIIRTQAPTKGAKALPAKAYHFIGSAMNACLLRSKTPTSIVSLALNPIAARMYRAASINKKLNSTLPEDLKNIDFEKLTEKDLEPIVEAYNSIPKDTRSLDEKLKGPLPEFEIFFSDPKNGISQLFPNLSSEEKLTTKRALEGIKANLTFFDAVTLAKSWWTKHNIPVVGSVYLPSQRNRPEVRDAGLLTFWSNNRSDRCEQKGWSKNRCERALAILDSWEIDFKWSEEQHYKGAAFGLKNCRELRSNETIETLSCQALQSSESKHIASPTKVTE